MLRDKHYFGGMTFGDIKELVNDEEFLDYPDDTPIQICITGNTPGPKDVMSIIGYDNSINFYNF